MRTRHALVLGCIWFLGCARAGTPATEEQSTARAPATVAERHELVWLPDGSSIAIDGRWLFTPERGTFDPLHCSGVDRDACRLHRMAFAPSGSRYAIVDGDRLAMLDARTPHAHVERVPRWLPETAAEGESTEIVNIVFWLTAQTLYIQQQFVDGHGEPECHVRDAATDRWRRPPGGCLTPAFSFLTSVDVGSGGLLALHSSAAGGYGLSIVRYDLDAGQAPTAVPALLVRGAGTVWSRFAPDGALVHVTSPCVLLGTPPPPCKTPFREPAWKLYALSTVDGSLRLERDDLEPGSAVDATGGRVAWVTARRLCIETLRSRVRRCVTLPGP